MTPTELASLEALAKAEPVAWRSVMNDPPVAMSVLARFFDNELGEWVYTVFDPGPVKLSIAGPYSEWLPLDTFNRTMYADNPAAILSLIEEYKRMREALERVRSTLATADESGLLRDVIWMVGSPNETLFDLLAALTPATGA